MKGLKSRQIVAEKGQLTPSRGRLPGETLTAQQQRQAFADKGLQPQEMVAILGAHTVSFGRSCPLNKDPYTVPCAISPCSPPCAMLT